MIGKSVPLATNTLSHLPADHRAVKSEWSKRFLVPAGAGAGGPDFRSCAGKRATRCGPAATEYIEAFLRT